MATMAVEVWVVIDCDGCHEVGVDEQTATERFEENVGALAGQSGFRTIKVVLQVPLPALVELHGEVPAEGAATLSVQ